ncbi:flagellar assembly peptidoglycan hydrolase FlgJ [Celerinatantimonas yamalensis]|uniref:Peptidoglycan hydrolase FlgJ n=1 Tax=Celerinatantimonas yamalensis TaxID=559956 RepID=A0ABW9G767_9GAMM
MELQNPLLMQNAISQQQSYNDLNQLDTLRREAKTHPHKALEAVAHQFEALFMQRLLEEMRKSNSQFSSSDSINNNRYVKNYQQMYDKQLSLDLSQNGSLGLAQLIVQQLDPDSAHIVPANQLRAAGSIEDKIKMGHMVQLNKLADKSVPAEVGKKVAHKPIMSMQARRFYGENPVQQPATKVQAATERQQFASEHEFVQSVLPLARQIAGPAGISPLAVVAQAALETGWGKRVMTSEKGSSSHNLFGIKAGKSWQGSKVRVNTLEFQHGVAEPKRANFRAYSSFADSVKDYVSLLQKPRYQQALAHGDNPAQFAEQLQQAGYATDPNYAVKMKKILDSEVLAQYQP